jgi:hypothetical protein
MATPSKGEEMRYSGLTQAAQEDSVHRSQDISRSPLPPSGLPCTMQEALQKLAADLGAAAKHGSMAEMTAASWEQVGAAAGSCAWPARSLDYC